jgi:hypothetical protein
MHPLFLVNRNRERNREHTPYRSHLFIAFSLLLLFCTQACAQKSFETDPYASKMKIKSDEAKLLQNLRVRARPGPLETPVGKKNEVQSDASPDAGSIPSSAARSQAKPPVDIEGKASSAKLLDSASFSRMVDDSVAVMPHEGKYSTSATASGNLKKAILVNEKGLLLVSPKGAVPSFCSSATYLAFLVTLADLQKEKRLKLTKEDLEKLLYARQPDGVGVWGRWNANGPGTARLFQALELGENFTEIEDARRGDFLKIWWSDEVGSKEHGHSVVYLGTRTDEKGVQQLSFWSSNIPSGYGNKEIPLTKAKHLLFSRLINPQNLDRLSKLAPRDQYLVSMSSKSVTFDDVLKELGIPKK